MTSMTEGPAMAAALVWPIVNLVAWIVILGFLAYAGCKIFRWLRKWNP